MSIDGFDPFLVLGVGYDCTEKEARKAALKLIKQQHPDKGGKGDDNLLRVIEAKKIFENEVHRACFLNCHISKAHLAKSWDLYRNFGSTSAPDSEAGNNFYENSNFTGDYEDRSHKRNTHGYNKGSSKSRNSKRPSSKNKNNDEQYYSNREYSNDYHNYNFQHCSDNYGGNYSKDDNFSYSDNRQHQRKSARTNNYERNKQRDNENEKLYRKKKQERAEDWSQQRKQKHYNNEFDQNHEEKYHRKKQKYDHKYWAAGDHSYENRHSKPSNYQTSFSQDNYQEEIIDLTLDDDLDFENIDIHDYSTSNSSKDEQKSKNIRSENFDLQRDSTCNTEDVNETNISAECGDFRRSNAELFCEDLIFVNKNDEFYHRCENEINDELKNCEPEKTLSESAIFEECSGFTADKTCSSIGRAKTPTKEDLILPTEEDFIHPAEEDPIHPAEEDLIHPAEEDLIHPAEEDLIHPAVKDLIHPAVKDLIHPAVKDLIHPALDDLIHSAVDDLIHPAVKDPIPSAVEDTSHNTVPETDYSTARKPSHLTTESFPRSEKETFHPIEEEIFNHFVKETSHPIVEEILTTTDSLNFHSVPEKQNLHPDLTHSTVSSRKKLFRKLVRDCTGIDSLAAIYDPNLLEQIFN